MGWYYELNEWLSYSVGCHSGWLALTVVNPLIGSINKLELELIVHDVNQEIRY